VKVFCSLQTNRSREYRLADKTHNLHISQHHNTNRTSHSPTNPKVSEAELEIKNIRLVNTTIVAKYLNHLFEYDNRLVLPGHFFPMSGVLFSFPIHNLGHLESFDQDWNRILTRLNGGETVPYDYKFGMHSTSVNFPSDKRKGNFIVRFGEV